MKRIIEYIALLGLTSLLIVRGLIPAWQEVHSDFANYYVSAKLVVDHQPLDSLYDNAWFRMKGADYGAPKAAKFSPFPPATAWMMVPLAWAGPLQAQRIFALLNVLFILPCIFLLRRLTGWRPEHCALLVVGTGLGLVNNVAFGQIYWIIAVSVLGSILLERAGYPRWAGVILGVFTALKYFPIVFIGGYFLLGKTSRRLVYSSLATLFAMEVLQLLFFGGSLMKEFFTAAFLPHLQGDLSGQGLYSLQFQSWNTLFRTLFVGDPEFNPHPLFLWATGKSLFVGLIVAIVSATMTGMLYRYKQAVATKRRVVYLIVPALGAMVILPASATYHFILLLVPVALLVSEDVMERKWVVLILTLCCLIGFIPYALAFRAAEAWGLIFGYPRLWLISAIYFIVIWGLRKRAALAP